MKRWMAFLLIVLLLPCFSGCGQTASAAGLTVDADSGFKTVASEQELKSILDLTWMDNMQYTLRGGMMKNSMATEDTAVMESEAAPQTAAEIPASTGAGEGNGAAGSSEVNAQVKGVDESDIVVNDGKYVYIAGSDTVVVLDKNLTKKATIQLSKADIPSVSDEEGGDTENTRNQMINEMYVKNGLLTIIASRYDYRVAKKGATSDYAYSWVNNSGYTDVIVYDVSDVSNISQKSVHSIEGDYRQSRKIDNVLYLISNYYVYSQDQILPRIYSSTDKNTEEAYQTLPVEDIVYCPDVESHSYSNILSLDVESGDSQIVSMLGNSSELYMNTESLYIVDCFTRWSGNDSADNTNYSAVARFSIDGLKVSPQNVGEVNGSPLNQFSMDEYDGSFRIALTDYTEDWDTVNSVCILDRDTMKVIGKVDNLAPGEMIYSVRFLGNTGYVVTFETMDPLFVLDLSDTSSPKVTGELKIPGFSNYLHPISDKYLLGIGQDTQEVYVEDRNTGEKIVTGYRTNGMKLSLFDVSDPENPVEKDVQYLGYNGTWSDVMYNHKALMAYGDLFAFAASVKETPNEDDWTLQNEAYVFRITDSIEPLAELKVSEEAGDGTFWNERVCVLDGTLVYVHYGVVTSYDMRSFTELRSVSI